MPQSFWLKNAAVITQNKHREIAYLDVFIEKGIITEITKPKKKSLKKRGKSAPSLDLSGQVLLPGFIQTHIHLCQTLFRNLADDLELMDWLQERIWPFEASHNKSSLRTSAELGIFELLQSGTTCILDMGTIRHTEEIFKTATKLGIRANIGKCLMDRVEMTPSYLREESDSALREAKKLFTKWNGTSHDRIRASFAPRFVVSCSEELLKQVGKLSKKHNACIHSHTSENLKELELVKELYGQENLEVFEKLGLTGKNLVLAHGIWLSEKEKRILKSTSTHLSHCPSSNLKLSSGVADIYTYLKEGISVSLGADGAPCNNRLDAYQELKLASLLQKPKHGPKAMNPQIALDLVTVHGAEALQWSDQIGTIEVGKKADLQVLNLENPTSFAPMRNEKTLQPETLLSSIVYSGDSRYVQKVWVDGVLLYNGNKVKNISEKELLERAKKEQAAVLKRARLLLSQEEGKSENREHEKKRNHKHSSLNP